MKPLNLLTTLILAATSLAFQVNAGTADPDASPKVASASGFYGPHITRKAEVYPFENYLDWLAGVKGRTDKGPQIDKFQRTINPMQFDRLKSSTESYWITYESDGLTISGAIAYPKNPPEGKLPVVIYNRGGNREMGQLSRTGLLRLILPLAEQGYLVLASNYRGARFSEGQDEFGGADVNDVTRLISLVNSIPNADPSRIAMVGWSRGVMMTTMAARGSTDLKAIALIAGPTDMQLAVDNRPEMLKLMQRLSPAMAEDQQAELVKRSAIHWAEDLNPDMPILLMHGTADWRVDVAQSRKFASRLEALERPYHLRIFEKGDHSLTFYMDEVRETLFTFLAEQLAVQK